MDLNSKEFSGITKARVIEKYLFTANLRTLSSLAEASHGVQPMSGPAGDQRMEADRNLTFAAPVPTSNSS